MIDELVKTVRLHLSERLTSPLMGAFIVSWCLWNYRMILVLLSDEPVLEKFRILQEVVYPDWRHILGPGLLLPLAVCLVYLFLYPYPAKWVYAYNRKRQREILEIRRKIEDETPLTLEDSRRLKEQLAKAEISHYQEIDRKDADIERLKAQVSTLQQELLAQRDVQSSDLKTSDLLKPGYQKAGPGSDLSRLLRETLLIMANYKAVTVGKLKDDFPDMDEVMVEYALDELHSLGLLSVAASVNGTRIYSLTHEGRGALIKAREEATAPV